MGLHQENLASSLSLIFFILPVKPLELTISGVASGRV